MAEMGSPSGVIVPEIMRIYVFGENGVIEM